MRKKEMVWVSSVAAILVVVVSVIYTFQQKESIMPYGITVAIKDQNTRMISWSSEKYDADSYIQWIEQQQLNSWDTDKVSKQAATITEFRNRNGEVFYRYNVELTNLNSNTLYSYRITLLKAKSDVSSFRIYDEQQQQFSFLHVTDSQGESEQDFKVWGNTLNTAIAAFPEAQFVVHGGDMVEDPDMEQQWKWFLHYADVLRSIPFMPTTGNHEQLNKKQDEFVTHFKLPNNGAKDLIEDTSYYFVYSNMLYISLNTEDDVKAQKQWLKEVLEEQRDQVKWIVVSMHRGVYGASRFNDGDAWVPLFDEYGVNLVLQGHNHEYSRSYPLIAGDVVSYNKEQADAGTVYVTLNAAGAKFNELKKDKDYQAIHVQNNKQMFGYVTVSPEAITYQAYDIDGQLVDEFQLK